MTTIVNNFTERFTQFKEDGTHENVEATHKIETDARVPKLGVMLVGLGGNNGTTFTAGIMANKLGTTWETKTGMQKPNYYGSYTQSSAAHLGFKMNEGQVEDVHKVIKDMVPLVDPNDLIIDGWDISGMDLFHAAKRAGVFEPDLLNKLKDQLEAIKPRPAAYNLDFIASNQEDRADNLIKGTNNEVILQIRQDIREFKEKCEKVLVLWTANTEKTIEDIASLSELEEKIEGNTSLPASVLYAYASICEDCVFLNGSPQNTLHSAIHELATTRQGFIGGADFKSGQTRFKTIMSDFLMGAGIRLSSVVSYNHLGNNDGKNLDDPDCFKSKQISKSSVLDDAIKSNPVLYPKGDDNVDHCVVIKYVPFVGDSKRALDEYSSKIFMNGINTITSTNVCEDSLLAVPIMIDMVLLGEFMTRVKVDEKPLGPVMSYLSFFFKAPVTNHSEYVINSFTRQRETLTNFLKACAGYTCNDNTLLSVKF